MIRCLDYSLLIEDKDTYRIGDIYPDYLYNDSWMDDINYLLNKDTIYRIFNVVKATVSGGETTGFDDYANWNADYTFGSEAVLNTYTIGERAETSRSLTEKEHDMILGNILQNVTDLADEHPEITFYLFFSPYSICYWDMLENNGEVNWHIDEEQVAIEELLKHPNIMLYSFCDNFDMVCNLDNYKDLAHYGEWVNSWMLEWMHDGEYLLTEDNYCDYLDTIR